MIKDVNELRMATSALAYRSWAVEVDDAGGIWLRRHEPDSAPGSSHDVVLTNQVHLRLPCATPTVLRAIWYEIRRAEDHERLEQFRCRCGRSIFEAHGEPDTQPPAGMALHEPGMEHHLCGEDR